MGFKLNMNYCVCYQNNLDYFQQFGNNDIYDRTIHPAPCFIMQVAWYWLVTLIKVSCARNVQNFSWKVVFWFIHIEKSSSCKSIWNT